MAATLTADNELTYASFPIEKITQETDGTVTVWGKATDDSVDSDNQIIDPEFASKAMQEFFDTGPNIRVQHQAQRDPAGCGISWERDGNAHWMKSRIIEPVAKQLVLGGALRAYSVGIARPTIQRDAVARGGRITDGQFVEVSLVDRPANKNCGIQLVKRASDGTIDLTTKVFGGDVLTKSDDVTVTLPADVSVGFSPTDLAKIVSRRNGFLPKSEAVSTAAAETFPVSITIPVDKPVTKGRKKTMMRAAQQAAEEEEKSATAMGGPNVVGGNTMAKNGGPHPGAEVRAHLEDAAGSLGHAMIDQHEAEEQHDEEHKLDGESSKLPPKIDKKKLTSRERKNLPSSSFVFPEDRRYPIHDRSHARNALARVSQHGSPEEKAKVRAAVARRYPGIEQEKKTQKMIAKAMAKAGAAMNPAQAPAASMKVAVVTKKDKSLCPGCGAMQNSQHSFCTECGKAMVGAPEIAKNHDFMCLGCGKELDKGEGFCPSCGKANPGHNPMADLKIPANKSEGSGVADDVTQAVTDQDGAQIVVKAKKMPKKGGKGKPFGGRQAPPFGKKPDEDADSKKSDAPLTDANMKSKVKPAKPVSTGQTPGHGTEEAAHQESVPGGAQDGDEFDRDASKSADPAVATQLRLKSLGMDTASGFAHDLVCAAYSWDDVMKSYPGGLSLMDTDEWTRKALEAAANAPLPVATAASRVGQAAFAIKSADADDLIQVKNDIHKAFRDANPGPGSAPKPGEICASHYTRPHITAGRASYGAHYGAPNSAPIPPEGGMSAQHFHRDNIRGETTDSPANMSTKGRAPVPDPPGVVQHLDYSHQMHKEQVLAAYAAMHDHFDRVFPGVCPMNNAGVAAHPAPVVKAETGAEVTKKVSKDGLTRKQRARRDGKLTRQVMKGKMSLDEARIKMGKKPVASPQPLNPAKVAEMELGKAIPGMTELIAGPAQLTKKDLRAALAKAQKDTDRKLTALATTLSALADQPDPGTQPWKGIAMNPMRTKSASPAGVQSVAEAAERSQMMVMRQLEQTARNDTNPTTREAAWQQVQRMRGLIQ